MAEWEKNDRNTAESDRKREIDDFWDVEKLLPERPARRTPPPPRMTPAAVEIELTPKKPVTAGGETAPQRAAKPVAAAPLTVTAPSQNEQGSIPTAKESSRPQTAPHPTPRSASEPASESAVHYVPPHKRGDPNTAKPLSDYQPDGLLLHRVRVFGWQANYHYFDSFVEEAVRYDGMKPRGIADKTGFFSYFPQYTQLSRRSEAWYLYWRELVRGGQYPDTDYAYILLYLFELINLPVNSPNEAMDRRDAMARVWMAYRKPFTQLDHYMCEWLCDYCLIHGLIAPVDLLSPALDMIIQESRLKEFYLSAAVRLPEGDTVLPGREVNPTALRTARILMRHCCQYDYQKSKFALGEHKELFDSTIPAAVAHVLPLLLGASGQKPAGKPVITMLDSTITRDAYTGALCSYRNKRRIEVSYTSFSRSHELRFLMADMVKHVENRLRSWIGVRSRLSVMSLPIPLRDALDAYLAPMEPPKNAIPVKKKEETRPAYEALYDLPRKAVSLEDAAAIEAHSWETTRILVEAFEEEDTQPQPIAERAPASEPTPIPVMPVTPPAPVPVAEPVPDAADTETASPLALYAPFIKAALDGDPAALRAAAKALGKMPDALADEINAVTADGEIGDIILEDDGMGGYTVIEDYRDQVLELL